MTMTVSQMTRKKTKLSKSVHSVVLGGGVVPTSAKQDLQKTNVTDLLNSYKRVLISALIRGKNTLN
jgi:hypothetical protein